MAKNAAGRNTASLVAVLGLGRFGSAVATELMAIDADVLGIDADEEVVQKHNARLTHVVRADTTDEEALRDLGLSDFERVVVAIGSDIEASILTCSLLLELGVRQVWAKAVTAAHARILERLGVHHVIRPETEMGRRVAHRVRGAMLDYVEIGTDFAVVRTVVPEQLSGATVNDELLWRKHRVKAIAVKSPIDGWHALLHDHPLEPGSQIQVVGKTRDVEAFSQVR